MSTKPWRATPLIESASLSRAAGCHVYLKLENLQPSGSFKSRGIGYYMLARLRERLASKPAVNGHSNGVHTNGASHHDEIHFFSSSGGNAGLAAVHAAVSLSRPCTVVVPMSTKPAVIAQMRLAGARDVIQHGASWREADTYLREEILAKYPGGVYVPPFDHEDIWTGNSSIVDELFEDCRGVEPDAIICSVGGGGLLSGVSQGLDRRGWSYVPVIAMETKGADSLSKSLEAGELITLPKITSEATTLGCTRVAKRTFECGQRPNVTSVVLSDAEAAMGCWRFADEERMLVEMSCGVNLAMCYDGRLKKTMGRHLNKDSKVIIILCGGTNISVDIINRWRQEYGWVEKKAPEQVPRDTGLTNGHA